MLPYPIKEVQYYINNSCNLSCKDCLSFNNFDLQGYFTWAQYEKENRKWAEFLLPTRVSILGGEPFLNPDIANWIHGIYDVWNNKTLITVTTNGTLLKYSKQKLIWKTMIRLGVVMEITSHRQDQYDEVLSTIFDFLQDAKIDYVVENFYNSSTGIYDKLAFIDSQNKNLLVTLEKNFIFENRTIKKHNKDHVYFYNNDPDTAHENCSINQCHYIVQGKLYKCAVVATWKELNRIIPIDKPSFDKLDNYAECDPFDEAQNILKFLEKLKLPISQCSVCTVHQTKSAAL